MHSAFSYNLTFSAAHASEGPILQPAYQQPAQTQQYSMHARATPAAQLHDNYHETLSQVSSAIRHDVDQFLVALPLGTSTDDAAVEEAVASKLYEALLSKAVMQHKLTAWYACSKTLCKKLIAACISSTTAGLIVCCEAVLSIHAKVLACYLASCLSHIACNCIVA